MLQGFFKTRSPVLVGVDIGASSIKLLQLSRKRRRHRVENHASQALPVDAVVEKHIKDLDAVAEGLRQLARRTGSGGAGATVAVAGSAVITKTLEMYATLSDSDLERQIVTEAEHYIPYPLDEVAFDFERQRRSPRHPERVEVLLAACRKENVDLRVSALERGGFQARVVDIEASAMERAYRLLREQMDLPRHRLVAIVDIGATLLTLYVLLAGTVIYTREQLFDGRRPQRALRPGQGLGVQETVSPSPAGPPPGFERDVLGPFRAEVSEEAARALQFFFSSSRYNEVDLIVLAGGVAATTGLARQVEESLGSPTLVAQPFARMELGPQVEPERLEQEAPSLMLACGLALRGV